MARTWEVLTCPEGLGQQAGELPLTLPALGVEEARPDPRLSRRKDSGVKEIVGGDTVFGCPYKNTEFIF